MTQRNPMNQRNKAEHKGVSRKSASSAKPAKQAGASVRGGAAQSSDNKPGLFGKKSSKPKMSDKEREELQKERRREQAMGAAALDLPEYKKYRRYWVIALVIAIIGIAASWGSTAAAGKGVFPESMSGLVNVITVAGLVVGYASIIIAFFIDFKKIRPIRKRQEELARKMTKKQKRELDLELAKADAEREATAGQRRRMPWAKKEEKEETAPEADEKESK